MLSFISDFNSEFEWQSTTFHRHEQPEGRIIPPQSHYRRSPQKGIHFRCMMMMMIASASRVSGFAFVRLSTTGRFLPVSVPIVSYVTTPIASSHRDCGELAMMTEDDNGVDSQHRVWNVPGLKVTIICSEFSKLLTLTFCE